MNENWNNKRTSWEYVEGKGLYGMEDRCARGGSGFLLSYPEAGLGMFIVGDLGISTSQVQSVNQEDERTILVKTKNSTYRVKLHPND